MSKGPVVSRLGSAALGLAGLVTGLDQLSKAWVLYSLNLPYVQSVPFFGPVHLTMVWNRGISYGFIQAQNDLTRWLLTGFSLAVAAALAVWVSNTTRRTMALSLGLVIGGAIGNAIDRMRFGAVVDFIDVSALMFPWVFNLADSAISLGVVLLLIDSMVQGSNSKPR